jgi:hypothetical protein
MSKYFHITNDLDSYQSIKDKGLKADQDGYIYLLTSKKIAAYVAKNQLFYNSHFALLEINAKGIEAVIESDNVAEFTAPYQRRVKQPLIKPDFIKLVNMYNVK